MSKYDLEPTEDNIKATLKNNHVDNKEYLDSIIRLLSKINSNSVICVDGDWGSGKTFLIKQLQYIIENINNMSASEYKVIKDFNENAKSINKNSMVFYYDAWANDEHKDPLESLVFSILKKYGKNKNDVINSKNTKDILKGGTQALVSILSQLFLHIDINSDFFDRVSTFNDLANEVNTFEDRKGNFRKLLDVILKDKRMILIIDELDRCNPTFATKMLEVIKHFYDYDKVTIIVVANNNQLQHTIKQQYGNEFDAYSYLNKFYDFVITIDNNRSVEYVKTCLDFSKLGFIYTYVFLAMVNNYSMTLRECNKYKTLYDSAKDLIESDKKNGAVFKKNEKELLFDIILPIIYAFKIKDINAYNRTINGKLDELQKTVEFLNKYLNDTEKEGWLEEFMEEHKTKMPDELVIYKIIQVYEKMMKNNNTDRLFLNAIRCSL